jgi:hypothetical protein
MATMKRTLDWLNTYTLWAFNAHNPAARELTR